MNMNSVLCRYIVEHPGWEQELAEQYALKIKREGPYAIFNYGNGCDFSDPIVQEARGIILDVERLEVVCWPFRKFGNFNESYADEIDWSTARVQEKIDGSIIKLWYDALRGEWNFSTNGMIRASEAQLSDDSGFVFGDVIRSAVNYHMIPFEALDREYTYIFEMVSPQTQIVVRYEQPRLYHIGTRSNVTGQEMDADIGIVKPASYPLHSLEDCIHAAEKLNAQVQDGATVEKEGFVVVDAQWRRVKIKSPDYLMTHRIVETGTWSMRRVLELIWEQKKDVAYLCRICPDDARIFLYYAYQLEELSWKCDRMAEYARALNREVEGDRRAVARVIAKSPLAAVGFWALGNSERGRNWLEHLDISMLMKHIPEYVSISIADLL